MTCFEELSAISSIDEFHQSVYFGDGDITENIETLLSNWLLFLSLIFPVLMSLCIPGKNDEIKESIVRFIIFVTNSISGFITKHISLEKQTWLFEERLTNKTLGL